MFRALLLFVFLTAIPLYASLKVSTPYDDRIDDEQQLLFLRRYPRSS